MIESDPDCRNYKAFFSSMGMNSYVTRLHGFETEAQTILRMTEVYTMMEKLQRTKEGKNKIPGIRYGESDTRFYRIFKVLSFKEQCSDEEFEELGD